jgi:hypothetical protein
VVALFSASLFVFSAQVFGSSQGETMQGFHDLALVAAAWGVLLWLYLHPSKHQRERAQRTQELRDWDWRS